MGARGRAPIAFLIDDIPLGAPQGPYVNSGERLAPGALVNFGVSKWLLFFCT